MALGLIVKSGSVLTAKLLMGPNGSRNQLFKCLRNDQPGIGGFDE
jgi:hypothetical protein